MTTIQFIQAKGGQGTTTVAALTALALAKEGRTLFVGGDDVGAVLGVASPYDGYGSVSDMLDFTETPGGLGNLGDTGGYDHIIIDGDQGYGGVVHATYLVTKQCFLALRAAVKLRVDGIVMIDEPGRALTRQDIERALGSPVVATMPWDPTVARAVDAGLLAVRPPATTVTATRCLIRQAHDQ